MSYINQLCTKIRTWWTGVNNLHGSWTDEGNENIYTHVTESLYMIPDL